MKNVYIVSSSEPEKLQNKLNLIDNTYNYIVLNSQNTDDIVFRINEITQNDEETFSKIKEKRALNVSFKNFLYKKIFEPNHLSDDEIRELCAEMLRFKRGCCSVKPIVKVEFINDPLYVHHGRFYSENTRYGNEDYITYINNINEKCNISSLKNLGLKKSCLPFSLKGIRGGILQSNKIYNLIYSINFLGNISKLSEKEKKFWSIFEKTFDTLAIYSNNYSNEFTVVRKPDIWEIKDDNYMYYCYGKNDKKQETYLINRVKVPGFLYKTPAEKLTPQDYICCSSVDAKAEFVKK